MYWTLFLLQKFQGRKYRQARLFEIWQSDLRRLSNAQTKISDASPESEICRGAGGLCGHCGLQQQEGPGPLSGLRHVAAPGSKDPHHPFLRRGQRCGGRPNLLRRRRGLLVAKNPATDVGFHWATL